MDLTKNYHDSGDNPRNILQMVEREPEWAANMIQAGEAAITEVERLTGELAAADGLIAALQSLVPHPGDGSCERCGSAPAIPVNLCDQCMDPEAVRP